MRIESVEPFDAQRQLLSLGISQREINTIKEHASSTRSGLALGRSEGILLDPDFLGGNSGLLSGNYQDRIEANLSYPPPSIELRTETSAQKGIFRRRTEIKSGTEVKVIKPVDNIAEEIASYTRLISDKGVKPVTMVDFGAGSSVTTSKVAHILKEDIQAGKVRIIATNIDDAPTEQDFPRIQRHFNTENARNIMEAISEKTVTFAQADILELYQMLKGSPIHLLFMVDMFPFTEKYNETLLRIVGETLDPSHGTAVFSFDKTRPDYPPGRPRLPIIRQGLEELREKGFTAHNPLQVEEGKIHSDKPLEEFEFEVYQGSEAPGFKLYTV